jgi:hypothetical protein
VTASLGALLLEDLGRYVPAVALASLSPDAALAPSALADRAVRGLTPAVLERLGAEEAARRIRALGALTGSDTARAAMPALERIARATGAPADPLRAASQCAGALLRVESPGGEEPGSIQLVAAVTRLVNAAVRAGLPAADAVAILAR